MIDIKAFRKANNLRQQVLADYLEVSRGFISLVETGMSKLSDDKLALLLANTNGWDTSMLLADPPTTSISAQASGNATATVGIGPNQSAEVAVLKAENELLRTQLAEAKAEKEKYWDMIQKLMK